MKMIVYCARATSSSSQGRHGSFSTRHIITTRDYAHGRLAAHAVRRVRRHEVRVPVARVEVGRLDLHLRVVIVRLVEAVDTVPVEREADQRRVRRERVVVWNGVIISALFRLTPAPPSRECHVNTPKRDVLKTIIKKVAR